MRKLFRFVLLATIFMVVVAGVGSANAQEVPSCAPVIDAPTHHPKGGENTIWALQGEEIEVRVVIEAKGVKPVEYVHSMDAGDKWTLPAPTRWSARDEFNTRSVLYTVHAQNACGYFGSNFGLWWYDPTRPAHTSKSFLFS